MKRRRLCYFSIGAYALLLLLSMLPLSGRAEEVFSADAAEKLYQEERYTDAAEAFLAMPASAQSYYNAGNCYYKMGEMAQAILYYERALLLNPSDEDILANLALAQSKTVDKMEDKDFNLFSRWFDQLRDGQTERAWSITSILLFLLFLSGLFLFFFGRGGVLKRLGFYGGALVFVLFIGSLFLAGSARHKLEFRTRAVVFAATANLRSAPDASGTALFVLHEGAVIRIKSTLGDWVEVVLPDGRVGWIEKSNIAII